MDELRRPRSDHRPRARTPDGCLSQPSPFRQHAEAPAVALTLRGVLESASYVGIAEVLSVTPGTAWESFVSALELAHLEGLRHEDPGTPAPEYVLYPAVELRDRQGFFCARQGRYPRPPKVGDRVIVILSDWTAREAIAWEENHVLIDDGRRIRMHEVLEIEGDTAPPPLSPVAFEGWLRDLLADGGAP